MLLLLIHLLLASPSHQLVRCWLCRHDDVIKWKHFRRNWPFVRGIHRSPWTLLTKARDAEFWSAPEQMVEPTIEMSVIWDAISLIMTSLYRINGSLSTMAKDLNHLCPVSFVKYGKMKIYVLLFLKTIQHLRVSVLNSPLVLFARCNVIPRSKSPSLALHLKWPSKW